NFSLNFDCGVSNEIRFRTRVQYNVQEFADQITEGWVIAQDIGFTHGKFRFSARHSLFDSDHYDNRQYIYESDAWSAYSLPAYAGVGVRNYALIEYKLNKTLTIWLRYARTRAVSGGEMDFEGDVIEGNTKNDVKFQARLK